MPGREFYCWQVHSFTVRLALDVVEKLGRHLQSPRVNPATEQGGLLFGHVIDTNSVEISGFEFIRSRHDRGAPYDLSAPERSNLERRVRNFDRSKGPKPVGYFRTHLRPGLFLDQSDFALMTEAFSTGPRIALAIRTSEPTAPNAGIFLWKRGDIDPGKAKLMFPFDAEKLRIQGPAEHGQPTAPAIPLAALAAPRKAPSISLVGGLVCALAGGIVTFTALTAFHHGHFAAPVASGAPAISVKSRLAESHSTQIPQDSAVLYAPPAAFEEGTQPDQPSDEPADQPSNGTQSAPRATRSPFELPDRQPVSPAPSQASSNPSQPSSNNAAVTSAAVARPVIPPPPPNTTAPAASPNRPLIESLKKSDPAPPRETNAVNVDVSVEPKENGVLKRIAGRVPSLAGHIPLLGRLHGFRHNDVVSARPVRGLAPPIPAQVSHDLANEVEVDVEASIDDQGVVRNAEVTRGAETQFGLLAVDRVRSVPWKPARSGDRTVPMDVVVHYRFSPTNEQ
jgi:hypothetical protein